MNRNLLIVALLAIPLIGTAQDRQIAAPTIRVTTRLVQINVIARDKRGPVTDLTKDDFAVLDEGKPQKIGVFSFDTRVAAKQDVKPLATGEYTNIAGHGAPITRGVTILLLDNLNTLTGVGSEAYETSPTWLEEHALANAKNHLIEYLKQLDPNERVAIYSLTDSLHILCDFSGDRAQLLAVVEKFDATSKTRREEVEPGATHTPVPGPEFNRSIDQQRLMLAAMKNEDRSKTTMDALRTIVAHVADIPGRKNLIWLTANLPYSGSAIARILSPAQIAAYPVDARGLLPRSEIPVSMMTGVDGDAVMQARDNMPAASFQPIGIEAMRKMAEGTGGRAFINTNDLTGAIRDAVNDGEASYTLGFYVAPESLDDKVHQLKAHVKRGGVELRYPQTYFASMADPMAASENRVRQVAVLSPLESSAILMRASVTRGDATDSGGLKIVATVDIHQMQLARDAGRLKGSFDFYVLQQDGTGKVIESEEDRVNLDLGEAEYVADLRSGVPCSAKVLIRPETATVRLLVQDRASSKIGSVIVPVAEIK